jgi:hypothetical protein
MMYKMLCYPLFKNPPHEGLQGHVAQVKKLTLLTTEEHDILLLDNDEPMIYTEALMGTDFEK